jgi:hypothetical protein
MKKKILVLPMVSDLIRRGILAMEGVRFAQGGFCSACGGPIQGYDFRKKRFATLIDDDAGTKEIPVFIKRFLCPGCGTVTLADAPFYPSTRHGAPIVDFALILSRLLSYHEVSRVLERCHIEMDWGTVRHYSLKNFPPAPTFALYGIPVPLSLLYLSILGVQLDKGGAITGAEALAACRLPPAHGALFELVGLSEERNKGDTQKKEEYRISRPPEKNRKP